MTRNRLTKRNDLTMETLDVVNLENKVIGQATIKEIYEKKLPHRICHVLVFNSLGEMLLQLRSKNMRFTPNHWSTPVGGHVSSGETYEQAALREGLEEIGVKLELGEFFDDVYQANGLTKFLRTFVAKHDGPFKVNPEEVEKVEFFALDKIAKLNKLHPELRFLLEKHYFAKT